MANRPAFVSYARQNSEFKLRLVGDLQTSGSNVWPDQLEIRVGRPWDSQVGNALKACGQLLVILSPTAVDSRNVMDEVAFALNKGKVAIPVMYRDCELPLRLGRIHYVDFRAEYQEALNHA